MAPDLRDRDQREDGRGVPSSVPGQGAGYGSQVDSTHGTYIQLVAKFPAQFLDKGLDMDLRYFFGFFGHNCYCSRSKQMPSTDQLTAIAPNVRTSF